MARPVVAIVGRPNVGKSTLFNKLIGKRIAIVDDTPGVTRDRIFGECEWRNRKVSLIDTGGIEPYSNDIILSQMRRQAQLAIEAADVIILVTDVKSGLVATDQEVATMLQKSGRPVVLCVNKCDKIGEPDPEFYEFYNLGLGDPIQVSSVHGTGTGDLLVAVYDLLPEEANEDEDNEIINVAVIGRPNVGKSSLINRITGEERCIVSNIAGTTRDSIDTLVKAYRKGNYTCRSKFSNLMQSQNDGIKGTSLYFGKQNSNCFINIYDKRAERGFQPEDMPNWMRIEIRLRSVNAQGFANKLTSDEDVGFFTPECLITI